MYKLSSSYKWVFRADGAFAYHITDRSVKAFNDTGAFILQQSLKLPIEAICATMKEHYDVEFSDTELLEEIKLFMATLMEGGYVHVSD